MAITDEKYVALTTYKRNGEARTTPVWIVDPGNGTGVFTTYSSSYKVGRIRNDARVTLQPCNAKGDPKPGSAVVTGTATLVYDRGFDEVKRAIKGKYGYQFTMIEMAGKLRSKLGSAAPTDTGVIVRFDS